MSNSVSIVFEFMKKDEFSETLKFCKMFDRFFDCLAGEGKKKRKPDLEPYNNVNDPRLNVRHYYVNIHNNYL